MRVLIISICSLLVLGMILLTTRFWGLGQPYQEFQHPFFQNAPAQGVILKVTQDSQIEESLKQKPDLIAFWIDVETSVDKKVIVFSRDFSEKDLSIEAYRGPKSQSYTFAQLKVMQPTVMELHDLLSRHPQQRFVLNVLDNVENVHLWIREALQGLEPEKRILLQSNYNVIMSSIKEMEPFWLYGCSQADLMRFLTFESMGILPATPFHGDVFIAPQKILNRPAYNEDILQEIRRRHKKILLGPVTTKEGFDYVSHMKPDAFLIENLSDFLKWSTAP